MAAGGRHSNLPRARRTDKEPELKHVLRKVVRRIDARPQQPLLASASAAIRVMDASAAVRDLVPDRPSAMVPEPEDEQFGSRPRPSRAAPVRAVRTDSPPGGIGA